MKYSIAHIASIVGGELLFNKDEQGLVIKKDEKSIDTLVLDSRKLHSTHQSVFFALKGSRRDGHLFIPELYKKGIRTFVISEESRIQSFPEAFFIRVSDTLTALQSLATFHRKQFDLTVIGVTGSNGKTIVKEWLYQLLHDQFQLVRSPKSFNSQIGVPLSVWAIESRHNLAIFEAGISMPNEMEKLEKIIRPDIGVLTNIGEAHNEGFKNRQEKIAEKLELFRHAKMVLGPEEDLKDQKALLNSFEAKPVLITWGSSDASDLVVKHIEKTSNHTTITVCSGGNEKQITIPFTDDASIENVITCYLVALQLGVDSSIIIEKTPGLQPVNMRLELKKAINQCILINDSYSADLKSLEIALNFQDQQSNHIKKTVILSDLVQSGQQQEQLYGLIYELLLKHQVRHIIGIGEQITSAFKKYQENKWDQLQIELFGSTDEYISQFRSTQFKEENILIKGARTFGFERIVQLLELKVHQTVLEINLNAIVHNVKQYQQQLLPTTKIMAMVKAFAYGSGGAEIAGILQFHKVDYLGVAYTDEGVELRNAGITLPIMVMNPDESSFESLIEYNLEPDIFSFELLRALEKFLLQEDLQQYPIHLEIETGMNRLGFSAGDIDDLASHLKNSSLIRVQSVFTHLAASEDPGEDEFTKEQYNRYKDAVTKLRSAIDYPFLQHISNTGAIFRLPELQLDMVRLGIGMYGVDSAAKHQSQLLSVATLKSTIAQIKHLKKGETVSYNRKGVIKKDSRIATVRIGYADGYSRKLGNGTGKMLIQGKLAPVIGTVCMDMTMVDITDIPDVQEGDEVIIFGKDLTVQQLAEWAGTIPYEIMTGISQRVKRVYFEE